MEDLRFWSRGCAVTVIEALAKAFPFHPAFYENGRWFCSTCLRDALQKLLSAANYLNRNQITYSKKHGVYRENESFYQMEA